MRPIPPKMREEIAKDPYMKTCCMRGLGFCEGRIEWHHNLIFAGRQVNEPWCIMPLCEYHHDKVELDKKRANWIMLNRATDDQLRPFCKAIDYIAMRAQLNKTYGTRS